MKYRYQSGDKTFEISLEREGDSYRAVVEGVAYHFEVLNAQPGELSLRFEGQPVNLYWAGDETQKWISLFGCTYRLEKPAPRRARSGVEGAAEDVIRAPMPAQVRSIEVSPGDRVEKGETLLLLEAMKMEIRIRAPRKGRIARIRVVPEQTVNRAEALVELEETEPGS